MADPVQEAVEIVERLREASGDLQRVAWSRTDGGQECSLNSILADQAADLIAQQAERIKALEGRLQAIIDWADFALAQPNEFNSHGVRNLDGPVFDEARALLPAPSEGGER